VKPTALFLALAILVAVAPAAPAASSDPDGYRLSGRYKVYFKAKDLGSRVWRLKPKCGANACDTAITSSTGFHGTLKYSFTDSSYVLKSRARTGVCSAGGKRLEDAYVDVTTITLSDFTGNDPAKYANGTRGDVYKPTAQARALGCEKPHERTTKVHLARM
jgi:hypothetical protein